MKYTVSQFYGAKQSRRLFSIIVTSKIKNFKVLLRIKAIANYRITIEDMDIPEKIVGPDVGSLRVKITRTKHNPVHRDDIKISKNGYNSIKIWS